MITGHDPLKIFQIGRGHDINHVKRRFFKFGVSDRKRAEN